LNLVNLFGKTYRTGWDPAYVPDYKSVPKALRDPWMMTILCRGGIVIYPYGGTRLAVEIDNHNRLARQISEILGVICTQLGDTERTYVFDVSLFEPVAAIVKPKKRIVLTDAQRQERAEQLRNAIPREQRLQNLAKARAALTGKKATSGPQKRLQAG
jgi:hypothetical protein